MGYTNYTCPLCGYVSKFEILSFDIILGYTRLKTFCNQEKKMWKCRTLSRNCR
jgi:hypothetical protein